MACFISHNFYCINCGEATLPIMRKSGQERGKFHRKKLYCYHCKQEINCVECKNENEIQEFKEMFNNGAFKDEAKESINHVKEAVI